MFRVYILECRDGTYYCGYTADLGKRLSAHGRGAASRYTRGRLPVKLAYCERAETKRCAMKRELEIKKFSRKEKETLIKNNPQSTKIV